MSGRGAPAIADQPHENRSSMGRGPISAAPEDHGGGGGVDQQLGIASIEVEAAASGVDEVVAELDSKRRAFLLEQLNEQAQTIVTTTELDIFADDFVKRAQVFNVIDGQIEIAE